MKNLSDIKFLSVAMLIIVASVSRLIPHPPNFTPILSMALFGGAMISNKKIALLFPIAAMLLSDLLIGLHSGMFAVYFSILAIAFIGSRFVNKPNFKNVFYNMNWGISHSCFTHEPFGYSIFEAVDYGKLPILHTSWCKNLEYPYRASSKKEFKHIYMRLSKTTYSEKNKWFELIKKYMIENYTNKDKWINQLLNIYNI